MSDNDDNFKLDQSAQELYKKLAGIDDSDRLIESEPTQSSLINLLNQETKLLDHYRLLLAEATCLFAGILKGSSSFASVHDIDQKIQAFLATLKKIAEFPGFDGRIFCRLRGQQYTSKQIGSEIYDYELSFSNLLLDYQMAQIIEEREKTLGKGLYKKLMTAFQSLSGINIFNFSFDTGANQEEDYLKLENTIRLLIKFYENPLREDFFVLDEYGQPNINLTILAATNNVKPIALQNLVDKIKPMILGPTPDKGLELFATVYDAIFASVDRRKDLKKMPIEVNNAQMLMDNLHTDPKRASVVVQVSRLVLAKYGSSPRMASEVINSINSAGYTDIRQEVMGHRLTHATGFLKLAEQTENREALQSEALRNIEEGLDHLPDEMYDNLSVKGSEARAINVEGQETSWLLHEKILDFLSFFIRRSSIKKKVQDITNKNIWFDDDDYAVIAKNFKITSADAVNLIALLRDCFDFNGNFRRIFFEKNIPGFIKCGSKVFEFLWHYLKELSLRNDRVSFLNALQSLVAQLEQPQDALNILLSDVFDRPTIVEFSDRNAFILVTALLCSSKAQGRSHIELTPEEVLRNQDNINRNTVALVLTFFEQNHENIIQKFRRIIELLLKSSAKDNFTENEMQPRFLLYLIREMVIFFALIGGKSAHAIIHGVVLEFGDPFSSYYSEMKNKENLRHSLQLLQIAARSLRRSAEPQDMELLGEIVSNEAAFIKLYAEPDPLNHVQRVMDKIRKSD
ncbi:MAG: hypothetical protein KKB30_15905 [Proteobacteria bacterium]|nr:hypothetical protein [Pseudomonadota bacterium]MBU1717201.1 hypothetical protein [Pseudomonadota bacterium]